MKKMKHNPCTEFIETLLTASSASVRANTSRDKAKTQHICQYMLLPYNMVFSSIEENLTVCTFSRNVFIYFEKNIQTCSATWQRA